jgi:hypothetical protein
LGSDEDYRIKKVIWQEWWKTRVKF